MSCYQEAFIPSELGLDVVVSVASLVVATFRHRQAKKANNKGMGITLATEPRLRLKHRENAVSALSIDTLSSAMAGTAVIRLSDEDTHADLSSLSLYYGL